MYMLIYGVCVCACVYVCGYIFEREREREREREIEDLKRYRFTKYTKMRRSINIETHTQIDAYTDRYTMP